MLTNQTYGMSRFGNLKSIRNFSRLWNGLKTACCFMEVLIPLALQLKKPPTYYEMWAYFHMHEVCSLLEHMIDCFSHQNHTFIYYFSTRILFIFLILTGEKANLCN